MALRARLLNRAFNLLYGPLVFLHEPAGRCLFGPSWAGRRSVLIDRDDHGGWLLDLGCGSGQLVQKARSRGLKCFGVDPSTRMLANARQKDLPLVQAHAQSLPIGTACIQAVVCSYPGSWIHDVQVWKELGRTTASGASLAILLGGTVTRGLGSRLRMRLITLMYGHSAATSMRFEPPAGLEQTFCGSLTSIDDCWGTAYVWIGARLQDQ